MRASRGRGLRAATAAAVALALVAPAALAAGPPASLPTDGLAWGNDVYFDGAAFARWLRLHHRSYESWRRLHPAGARTLDLAELEARRPPSAGAPPHDLPLPSLAPARATARPAAFVDAPPGSNGALYGILAAATVCALVGAVPAARLGGWWSTGVGSHRYAFLGAAALLYLGPLLHLILR